MISLLSIWYHHNGYLMWKRNRYLVYQSPLSWIFIYIEHLGLFSLLYLGQDENMDGYSFGSALPSLEITWTLEGTVDKGSLQGSWDSTGFALSPTNAGVAVFKVNFVSFFELSLTISLSLSITLYFCSFNSLIPFCSFSFSLHLSHLWLIYCRW